MTNFLYVLAVLLCLVALIGLGFFIRPRPFRAHPVPSHPGEPTPLRPDLPEPVRRHFLEMLGPNPPRITSAVLWGRGKARIRGVWAPLRFKAWYRPGEAFYRRMEITWFQRPVLRVHDSFINGEGIYEMGGKEERGPGVDQSEALMLWAEAVWMPSVLVHDPRVRWEAVDEHTARLILPFEDPSYSLLAHFDAATGRMTHLSGDRYSTRSEEMEPWRVDLEMQSWKEFNGVQVPAEIAIAWGEAGAPTSYWDLDGLVYNVNVSDQLGEKI